MTTKKHTASSRQSDTAAADNQREQFSFDDIDRIWCGFAIDVMCADRLIKPIMALLDEIATHPFDHSHVETIANLGKAHLFAVTSESDEAEREYTAAARRELLK